MYGSAVPICANFTEKREKRFQQSEVETAKLEQLRFANNCLHELQSKFPSADSKRIGISENRYNCGSCVVTFQTCKLAGQTRVPETQKNCIWYHIYLIVKHHELPDLIAFASAESAALDLSQVVVSLRKFLDQRKQDSDRDVVIGGGQNKGSDSEKTKSGFFGSH